MKILRTHPAQIGPASSLGRGLARTLRRGFTLAEMMVVIVIIGLLATLVVPNVLEKFGAASKEKARADITQIINALNEYAIRNGGKFPDSLDSLVQPDTNGLTFLNAKRVPKDPWKNEYQYEPPTPGSGDPDPHVWSTGKDGQNGGEDDIDSKTMNESD